MPIVPATQLAEAGGSLKFKGLEIDWVVFVICCFCWFLHFIIEF